MPLVPFNSVGGYATGITGTTVIDANGNIFAAGISAAGATFSGNVVLQNQEFIRNTTNGRMDFMPAPAGSTHYGMYLDFTSWGFGPRFGTIRSSDGALNTTGILWDAQLYVGNNVRFNFGSNGQNGVVLSDTGNDTIQLFTNVTSGTNSGAVAIVDVAGVNAANRAPGTTHANPNLYIYRAGSARATDFIRFEHDGTNGRIVSGGTSGISIEPGSGAIGISGGLNASGATFTADISVNGAGIGLGSGNCGSNLVFGSGAYASGAGFTGQNNLAIGLNALAANRAGDVNVGIGRNALTTNTNGRNNTAIGAYALSNLNGVTWGSGFGEYNVAIGGSALFNATTASYNMAIGSSSLTNNTSGFENVAIGTFALIRNNTGNDNVAIGHQALGPGFGSANPLTENVSIGWNSLFNTNNTSHNVAIGPQVGFSNTTGASNTLVGRRALYNNGTGSENIAIGSRAGEFAGTGGATLGNSNDSIFIGFQARSRGTTSSNEIVIGSDAVGKGANTAVIGATTQTAAYVYGQIYETVNEIRVTNNARSWFL